MCLPVSFTIYKLWGENPSSVYAVGANGNIMHYSGTTWQRVESATMLDIKDIWVQQTRAPVGVRFFPWHQHLRYKLRRAES